jgi:hypothetical protein
VFEGNEGDDVIRARDGYADRGSGNGGVDRAYIDALDVLRQIENFFR